MQYGAQPAVEILRQFMDGGGWYNRDRADKEATFRNLVDVQMVCAMGPPGGGKNPITQRFTRHFNVFSLTDFDDETLTRIFTVITNWFAKPFGMTLSSVSGPAVSGMGFIFFCVFIPNCWTEAYFFVLFK